MELMLIALVVLGVGAVAWGGFTLWNGTPDAPPEKEDEDLGYTPRGRR